MRFSLRSLVACAGFAALCSGTGSAHGFEALHWRSIGPAPGGGRVAAVAGSDADPYLYLVGAAGGGVFRTRNGGATWDDVWAKQPVGGIGAVAIAPSDPGTMWVGTGEAKPRNDASYGNGVYLSTDGGAHWQYRGLSGTRAISRILIDPHNPSHVLVGALGDPFVDSRERGVYVTDDAGRTWRRTLYAGPQSGIADLAWDGRHPALVFAAVWQLRRKPWTFASGGPIDGLWRSNDGGSTWVKLVGHGLPAGPLGRIGIAVAPADPRRVYAVIQSRHGIAWRSDNGGDDWRKISDDTLLDQRPFYNSRLDVDPSDPDHVYFSAENLIETRDGGRTYRELRGAIHQDHHGLWIARDGKRMIDANDGGAPISLDGGVLWDWRANLTLAQLYHVGFDDAIPYHVCGGLQDNDTFCGPSDSLSPLGIRAGSWRDVGNDGDGSTAWPEPGRPDAIWNVGVNSLNGQLGIFSLRSSENVDVTPYVRDTNGIALAGLPYRFNWEAPLAFSRTGRAVAYFGANVLFGTRDRGRHWQTLSPDLTRNERAHQQIPGGPIDPDVSGAEFYDTILDIAPSPLAAGTIWVGTDDGRIQLTRDGGRRWNDVSVRGLAPYGRVATVEASRFAPGRAYAAVDRHLCGDFAPYVFATEDYGRHWRSLGAGLPAEQPLRVVREDPRNPDVLYAGLEQGVRISFDRGRSWRDLRLNMPPVSIYDLRVHPRADDIVLATHGRGFFILDDAAALQGYVAAAARARPALFPLRPAYRFWPYYEYTVLAEGCCAPPNEAVGENPPKGALLTYYLPRTLSRPPEVEIVDPAGSVVRRLRGTNEAGLNRVAWDLAEEPPTPWYSARPWNRGPGGATVVPGTFAVRLRANGVLRATQPLRVLPDPRTRRSAREMLARRDFVRALVAEMAQIDVVLNGLDSIERHAARLDPALVARARGMYRRFTSNPRNSEDQLLVADRLRERLTNLFTDISFSEAPPSAAHRREAAAIRIEFVRAMAAFRADRQLAAAVRAAR